MARKPLDTTGNEYMGSILAKINDNFIETYAAETSNPDPTFTTATASGLITGGALTLDTGTKTATAVAGAATLAKDAGVITSEALTTAAGATYTLTLTNSSIAAADQVFVSVSPVAGTGTPVVASVIPAAGSVVIVIQNIHASAAFNAAIKISFMVLKN